MLQIEKLHRRGKKFSRENLSCSVLAQLPSEVIPSSKPSENKSLCIKSESKNVFLPPLNSAAFEGAEQLLNGL